MESGRFSLEVIDFLFEILDMPFFSLAEGSLTTSITSQPPTWFYPVHSPPKKPDQRDKHTQPDSEPSSYSDPKRPHPSPHYYSDPNFPQHQYYSDSADYLLTTASATPVVNVAVAGSDDDDDDNDNDVVVADAGQTAY